MTQRRYTIAEVEGLMAREDVELDIQPDGTVVVKQIQAPLAPLMKNQNIPSNY